MSGPDVPVIDPAVAQTAMRVAIARKAKEDAERDYRAVQAAAQITFADLRRRGIPSHEVRLPDGTKVALISIKTGAQVTTVDEDALTGVIAVNEPEAFEDIADAAALGDPEVLALLAVQFPGYVRTRIRPDVAEQYRKEAGENGGRVFLRAGRQAGEQVQVAAVEHRPATGDYSVIWADRGKGMVLLGEALDAGLVSPWGETAGPLPPPEPDVAEPASEPDRAAMAQKALAAEKKARPRRAARNGGSA